MSNSKRDALRNILSAVQKTKSAIALHHSSSYLSCPPTISVPLPSLNLPYPDDLVSTVRNKHLPNHIVDGVTRKIDDCVREVQALHKANFTITCAKLGKEDSNSFLASNLVTVYERLYHENFLAWLRSTIDGYMSRIPSESDPDLKRPVFNSRYTPVLEKYFQKNAYPSAIERRGLAQKSGMTPRQIEVWFQNHRNRSKKEGHPLSKPSSTEARISLEALEHELLLLTDLEDETSEDDQSYDEIYPAWTSFSFGALSPQHAFPTRYPPQCSYDPFPVQNGERVLPTPQWPRKSVTKVTNHTESIGVDQLADLFAAKLTLREGSTKVPKQKTSRFKSGQSWFCATVTVPSPAPHPALVRSASTSPCSFFKPTRHYSPFPASPALSANRRSLKPRLTRRLPNWSRHSPPPSKPPSRTASLESILSCDSSSSSSSLDELPTPPHTPLQPSGLMFNDLFDNPLSFDFPDLSPPTISFNLDASNKSHSSFPPIFSPFEYATSS